MADEELERSREKLRNGLKSNTLRTAERMAEQRQF